MTGRQSRAIGNLGAFGGGETSQQANGCDWVICQQVTGPRASVWGLKTENCTVLQKQTTNKTGTHTVTNQRQRQTKQDKNPVTRSRIEVTADLVIIKVSQVWNLGPILSIVCNPGHLTVRSSV